MRIPEILRKVNKLRFGIPPQIKQTQDGHATSTQSLQKSAGPVEYREKNNQEKPHAVLCLHRKPLV